MTTPQQHKPYRVLFLCTGNSARSVLAEYLLRKYGAGRFESFSAGAQPSGTVNPHTLRVLQDLYQVDASQARSKSLNEFLGEEFDFVITVCDNARESCPVFPGYPVTAHWGSEDPAAFQGTDAEKFDFFAKVAMQIRHRVELFAQLPFEKLDRLKLEQMTRQIGHQNPANA